MGKFRLKIVESSFSKDYVYFKYTTNGIFWKTIKNYEYVSLDEYCYMVPLLKKFTEVEHYFNKFKTLDDIVKFEELEFKKVVKHNTQINHLKNESTKKRDEIYKKYS